MNMSLGELVASTAIGDGRLLGWDEFWDLHAASNEWATHAQLIAASSYYQRPVVAVTSMGAQTVVAPDVDPSAPPLFIMLSMASVTVPGHADPLAAHHYEGLFVITEVSHIDPSSIRDAVDGGMLTVWPLACAGCYRGGRSEGGW
jgi:hypothetical protein